MICNCCKRDKDLRFGFCFDCVNAESIIADGVDMYDKPIESQKGFTTHMNKLQEILKIFNSINPQSK